MFIMYAMRGFSCVLFHVSGDNSKDDSKHKIKDHSV